MSKPAPISHRRAWVELAFGAACVIAGIVITVVTFGEAEAKGSTYVIAFGPVVVGVALVMHALSDLAGYRSFVAWRYLLVSEQKVKRTTKLLIAVAIITRVALTLVFLRAELVTPTTKAILHVIDGAAIIIIMWGVLRNSKPAFWLAVTGFVIWGLSLGLLYLTRAHALPFGIASGWPEPQRQSLLLVFNITAISGLGIAGLAAFFGTLRSFFTFFTTVPIGGVWIGTGALVLVLAVMSGFESDLREKILGSNAHIQITREDGEFNDWRAIKDRIDKVPGVVASTPYAVSEVVIAAHNNGMNVIIKGIDPATVANVTDLVSDLEDKDAIKRMAPLAESRTDLVVPQKPHDDNAVDPAPTDLPTAADPIDFSGGDDAEGATLPPVMPATPAAGGGRGGIGKMLEPPPSQEPSPSEYGGDARDLQEGDRDHVRIEAVDIPEPSLSRRTQLLPGVLVGRELVKQTHLYTGEEVRVVSPLSDPSNPDATGTPIPFNRDYRVAGIFFTGMYEYDLKYVYVTLDSLQDFLDRGDAIDGIEVRVTHADDSEHMVKVLGKVLGPSYRIVDWRELNRSLFSALKLEKIAMFLVLGIVILVASFSIVGNLIMVVVEKARQIALLKTLGASNSGMMQLFAIQGMMIGMIGTVLGIVTGLIGCWAGKRFGLPLDPDVYYIDRLPIHVDPQSVAAAAAAGILISIAATLYPALLAARVRPAAGMRH